MAPDSSTFTQKIPWTEEPGRPQSMGSLELDMTEQLPFLFSLSCIGEGHGNPLQCSCLENPRDGGPWWAAVYGVAQSRTRLKRLSSSSSSIADLQCCNSFRYTAKQLSQTYTCIHSPPNPLPSKLLQPHNMEQSSLCYTVGHYMYQCIYVNHSLPIYPSSVLSPWTYRLSQ